MKTIDESGRCIKCKRTAKTSWGVVFPNVNYCKCGVDKK